MNSYLSFEAASSASRQLLAGTSAPQEALLNVFVDGQAMDVPGIMDFAPQLWVWVCCDAPAFVPQAISTEPATAAATQEARAYALKWILQKDMQGAESVNGNTSPQSPTRSPSKLSGSPSTPLSGTKAAAAAAAARQA